MYSSAAYKITEKKCATCSYWCGEREIEFRNYKPFYIKASVGKFPCLVDKNKNPSATTFCLKWRLWEKIG
jgi:hypothetical protein